MKACQIWIAALILSVGMIAFATPAVRADDTKVATCDPLKAVTTCKEFKDYEEKVNNDRKAYENLRGQKEEELNSMNSQLKMLVVNSPEYATQNKAILQKQIEYRVWQQITELGLSRDEKNTLKLLFDKMQSKCAEVAKKKGIELVISDRHADLPEDMSKMEESQFWSAIMERSILYNDPKLDITNDVIQELDAAYANKN